MAFGRYTTFHASGRIHISMPCLTLMSLKDVHFIGHDGLLQGKFAHRLLLRAAPHCSLRHIVEPLEGLMLLGRVSGSR